MKEFLSLILVLGLSATLLAGCGGSKTDAPASTDATTDASYNKLNIIVAHGAAETTSEHASFLKFKESIEEKSGGSVTVDLYTNQQLSGDREYTEIVTQGNVTRAPPPPQTLPPSFLL